MKKVLKYILTFITIIILFNIIMLLGTLHSSDLIEENVKKSSNILLDEGNDYKMSKYFNIVNNNYTDALMINETYSIDNKNPIYSYMTARKNYKREITKVELEDTNGELISLNNSSGYDPVGELADFLDGKIDTSVDYARYWHGYLPILRLLLIIFDISEIRTILLITFIILYVLMLYLLNKKINWCIALIFGFSLIAEGYFFVSYSLESSPIFLVMMISSIILLSRIDKIKSFYLYIFITACISNFVDYLTVPLITLAIPLYIYIIYNQKNNNWNYNKSIKTIIIASLIWILGYGLTWLSKWIIYDAIYHKGLIKSAIKQVLYRSGSYNQYNVYPLSLIITKLININIKCILFFMIIFIYIGILVTCKLYFKKIKIIEFFKINIPILIISIMPFVWYIALENHTRLHYKFTYRHMLIFLIGMLLCITSLFKTNKKDNLS